jgi:CRISPR-associated protein Cmr2
MKTNFGHFAEKEFTDKGKSFKISLSAGISVTYYKFPLQEALNISYDLLNEKAKKFDGKNAVAFKVLKHSGQTFETIFKKTDNCLYIRFKELINLNIDDGQFFSSVIQKSFENFDLLEMVADNKNRIHAYHKEFYNESFHGTKKDFIDQLETYIHELFQSQEYKNKKDDLYAALRMVKFLNREDNE